MKKQVAINASNLHMGGGVQVAVSFIEELSRIRSEIVDFHIICSRKVDGELSKSNLDTRCFSSYHVLDIHGLEASFSRVFARALAGFDLVFTVFGPDYRISGNHATIVGFAQPWILYPRNELFCSMSFPSKLVCRLRFFSQKLFFRRSSRLIVELPHVKERLIRQRIAPAHKVNIVFNSVSNIYFTPERWEAIDIRVPKGRLKLGFIGRDYPHKNLIILPEIKSILKNDYQIDVEMYVTLTQEEWEGKPLFFRDSVNTVGELSISQCPSFYNAMDAIIFPSLLECFSATPLEAMIMGKPLFASDRGFVKDVCQEYAYYFDPVDPASAARVIARHARKVKGYDGDRMSAAREHARQFSSSRGRAEAYVKIIEMEVS